MKMIISVLLLMMMIMIVNKKKTISSSFTYLLSPLSAGVGSGSLSLIS
mgnify:CR=1 FL=1